MPALLVAAALAAYANSFYGSFVLDDNYLIVEKAGEYKTWTPEFGQRWLVKWTFKLNYLVGGLQEAGYHAVNLAFHIACALLVYGLILRTSGALYRDNRQSTAVFAGLTALLWTVHPLNTESVTYICQRYESMMGMFALLTLYLFVRGVQSGRSKPWLFASVSACLAGMGTKEVMVVVPLVVLAYDYVFVSRGFIRMLKARWLYYAGLIATLPALSALELRFIRQVASGGGVGSVKLVSPLSVWQYLITQAEVILHYLRVSFIPFPLCLDYAWEPAGGISDAWLSVMLVTCLLVAGVVLVIFKKSAGFPIIWFFAFLSPSSSIIPLADIAAEHRMYMPLAGVVVLVSCILYRLIMHNKDSASGRAFIVAGVVLLAGALGFRTYQRNKAYYSENVMWSRVIKTNEENLRARNTLASILLKSGRETEALRHLKFVLDRTSDVETVTQRYSPETKFAPIPSNSDRHNRVLALANLGVYYEREGKYDIAADHYIKALRLFPYKREVLAAYRSLMRRRGLDPAEYEQRLTREVWFFDR